jgi:polyhydroxybutyrate depolymerase
LGVLESSVTDINFISDLLTHLRQNYAVDTNRIYAYGLSNGGLMSYDLACFLTDKFAAIASVSGGITPQHFEACTPSHPLPVMEIH